MISTPSQLYLLTTVNHSTATRKMAAFRQSSLPTDDDAFLSAKLSAVTGNWELLMLIGEMPHVTRSG